MEKKRARAKREGHKGIALVHFGPHLRNLGTIFTSALLIRWSGYSIHIIHGFIMCCEFNLILRTPYSVLITMVPPIDPGLSSPRAVLSAGGETKGMPETVIHPWPWARLHEPYKHSGRSTYINVCTSYMGENLFPSHSSAWYVYNILLIYDALSSLSPIVDLVWEWRKGKIASAIEEPILILS